MNIRKFAGFAGICKKAGGLVTGTYSCVDAVKKGRAKSVYTTNDTAKNNMQQLAGVCGRYDIPYYIIPMSKQELGAVFGKDVMICFAVTDSNFSEAIYKLYNQKDGGILNDSK